MSNKTYKPLSRRHRLTRLPKGFKSPRRMPALGSITKRVKALTFKPVFLRVTCIEIQRFDWEKHDQVVCLRLLPTMKPDWFSHRVRVLA